jgi:hypothetical protein
MKPSLSDVLLRPVNQTQQSTTGFFQAVQDLQAVSLATLQRGQDHRFEMPAQLVALNRFHAFILDKLGIGVKSGPRRDETDSDLPIPQGLVLLQ